MANTDKIIFKGPLFISQMQNEFGPIKNIGYVDILIGKALGSEVDGIGWNYVYEINNYIYANMIWDLTEDIAYNKKVFGLPDIFKKCIYYNISIDIVGWGITHSILSTYQDYTIVASNNFATLNNARKSDQIFHIIISGRHKK